MEKKMPVRLPEWALPSKKRKAQLSLPLVLLPMAPPAGTEEAGSLSSYLLGEAAHDAAHGC